MSGFERVQGESFDLSIKRHALRESGAVWSICIVSSLCKRLADAVLLESSRHLLRKIWNPRREHSLETIRKAHLVVKDIF